jgi:hypothetical protein
VIRLIRNTITVALTLAIAFVAVPLSVTGAIALAAGLSGTGKRADALLGLELLGIASLICGALFGWLALCGLLPIPNRFSLRALMILTTLLAVVLSMVFYATR